MKVERDDPSVWKELYEQEKQLAADADIEPRTPRTAGRQQHRVNIPAETPEMYWQRAVCFNITFRKPPKIIFKVLKAATF